MARRRIQERIFERPIPGASLAVDNDDFPWSKPPMISDPDDAITHVLNKFEMPKARASIVETMLIGVPIEAIVTGITKQLFQIGLISVDTMLVIRPPLALYLTDLAEGMGIPYKLFAKEDAGVIRSENDENILRGIKTAFPDVFEALGEELNKQLRDGAVMRESAEKINEESFVGSNNKEPSDEV
tara:strand:+ start:348 stop:902 length:555 start_codon:yes stop_codon:yes gene_type:complete